MTTIVPPAIGLALRAFTTTPLRQGARLVLVELAATLTASSKFFLLQLAIRLTQLMVCATRTVGLESTTATKTEPATPALIIALLATWASMELLLLLLTRDTPLIQ